MNKSDNYNPIGIILLLIGIVIMFVIGAIVAFQEYPISTFFGSAILITIVIAAIMKDE